MSTCSFFLNFTSDPTHQELFQYIAGVRQLTQLLLGMEDLSSEDDHTPPSPDKLQEVISHCHKALCHFPFPYILQVSWVVRGDLEMRQFITMLNYSMCSRSIGILPLEEIHCETPLSLSLAFVINAHCERNLLYLPGDISQ